MEALKSFGRYSIVFIVTIILMFLLIYLVFCIPDDMVSYHSEVSKDIVDGMEEWIWFGNFFGSNASRLDNTTDTIMLSNVMPDDLSMSTAEKAMSVNNYARYWHGYLVILRPLLVLFDFWQIRYINMIVFYSLLALLISLISSRFGGMKGIFISLSLMMSFVLCYIVIIPVSLQFYSVFLVVLVASNIILLFPERIRDYPMLFMITGMITNYVDFLTAPVLSLGIPLLLLLALNHHSGSCKLDRDIKLAVSVSIAWCVGYGLCWLTKWGLGSIILKYNVMESVERHSRYWLSDAGAGSRLLAFKLNVQYYFIGQGLKASIPALVIPAGLIVSLFYRKKHAVLVNRPMVFLLLSLYPYVWYLVMNGHSFYHAWFTFRAQAITYFGICLFLIELNDFDRRPVWQIC